MLLLAEACFLSIQSQTCLPGCAVFPCHPERWSATAKSLSPLSRLFNYATHVEDPDTTKGGVNNATGATPAGATNILPPVLLVPPVRAAKVQNEALGATRGKLLHKPSKSRITHLRAT